MEERARRKGGWKREGEEEKETRDNGKKREMFLMTLETDTRTATQLLLQDFSLSLYLPAFLSVLSASL